MWRSLAQSCIKRKVVCFAVHGARRNVTTALALGARTRSLARDLAREFVEWGLESLGTKRFADVDLGIGETRRGLTGLVTLALRRLIARFGRLLG